MRKGEDEQSAVDALMQFHCYINATHRGSEKAFAFITARVIAFGVQDMLLITHSACFCRGLTGLNKGRIPSYREPYRAF